MVAMRIMVITTAIGDITATMGVTTADTSVMAALATMVAAGTVVTASPATRTAPSSLCARRLFASRRPVLRQSSDARRTVAATTATDSAGVAAIADTEDITGHMDAVDGAVTVGTGVAVAGKPVVTSHALSIFNGRARSSRSPVSLRALFANRRFVEIVFALWQGLPGAGRRLTARSREVESGTIRDECSLLIRRRP
jgi:hypothetical protein